MKAIAIKNVKNKNGFKVFRGQSVTINHKLVQGVWLAVISYERAETLYSKPVKKELTTTKQIADKYFSWVI